MHTKLLSLAVAVVLMLSATLAYADTIAYADPLYAGNQAFAGNLGSDFNVNSPIVVTQLGAFDANGNGFAAVVFVQIYNRDTKAPQLFFNQALIGTLDPLTGGDRFAALGANSFVLLPGHYSVVANYTAADNIGNFQLPGFMPPTESGGPITFVGARYDANASIDLPTTCVGCTAVPPAAQWNAGTFQFVPLVAPTIAKSFALTQAGGIFFGDTTSMTITLTNPNAAPLTGVAFTDTLPAGLVIATPNGLADSCALGATAPAGTSTISLAGAILPGSSTCTITVKVSVTAGDGLMKNTTSTLTSNEAPPGAAATATIFIYDLWWLWFFFS
jgi:uncharacterized repeat protein (TIGR01451 family)